MQKLVDVLVGQGIEAEHLDGSAGRHLFEMIPVICSEPIGLATRQAKTRTPHSVEFGTDTVQWSTPVGRSGPCLVQPIDKKSRIVPLGPVVEGQEIARGDATPALAFRQMLENGGLAGAWRTKQHVGRFVLPILNRSGRNMRRATGSRARRVCGMSVERCTSWVVEPFPGRRR